MRPLRTLVKALGRSAAVRAFLCWLISLYIRLVMATGRWEEIGRDGPQRCWDDGTPFIFAFWHGRLMMMASSWVKSGKPMNMLASSHRDGQLIARTVAHFGIKQVTGSSTRGGSAALRGMLKALKDGEYVGITPDGPRGPRMRAQDGAIAVAKLSGAAIFPAAVGAERRWLIDSWDRFLVPKPFSRGVFVWGEPIFVPRDADAATMESLRQRLEETLNALTADADRRMGHAPVDPAPMAEAAP